MNKAYLLTGSNLGDRLRYLELAAQKLLAAGCKVLQRSSIYETAAWGKADQPAFLNQVLLVETALPASELLSLLLHIEKEAGRKRIEKYGPRTIDIDILLFNESVINSPELTIPHSELANRQFALMPLAEIAGTIIHPVLHKTIDELLAECKDPLPVKRLA